MIGEDGSTKEAADAGSSLSDHAVIDCVVGAFRRRTYPVSYDGNITVIYPIQFGS